MNRTAGLLRMFGRVDVWILITGIIGTIGTIVLVAIALTPPDVADRGSSTRPGQSQPVPRDSPRSAHAARMVRTPAADSGVTAGR